MFNYYDKTRDNDKEFKQIKELFKVGNLLKVINKDVFVSFNKKLLDIKLENYDSYVENNLYYDISDKIVSGEIIEKGNIIFVFESKIYLINDNIKSICKFLTSNEQLCYFSDCREIEHSFELYQAYFKKI